MSAATLFDVWLQVAGEPWQRPLNTAPLDTAGMARLLSEHRWQLDEAVLVLVVPPPAPPEEKS